VDHFFLPSVFSGNCFPSFPFRFPVIEISFSLVLVLRLSGIQLFFFCPFCLILEAAVSFTGGFRKWRPLDVIPLFLGSSKEGLFSFGTPRLFLTFPALEY